MLFLSSFAFAGGAARPFTLADASGANTLTLGFSFQPRFVAQLDGDPDAPDAEAVDDTGFRVRRMLFTADGTVAGDLKYRFRIDAAKGFSFVDGDGATQQATKPILDDAQIAWAIDEAFTVYAGQYKVPFLATQMHGDTSLLFHERPLLGEGLKLGDTKVSGFGYARDVGAHVGGTVAQKRLEYEVGVFDGDGANVWPPADTGFLYVERVAVAPLGEMSYDEVDFGRGPARFAVGASANLRQTPTFTDAGAFDGADDDLRVGGELRFRAAGLSVNGEVAYGSDTAGPTSRLGAYAQAGYYLPIGVAPGVRWSRLDPDLAADGDAVTSVEGVVNVFLPDPARPGATLEHKAKLQAVWTTLLQEGRDAPIAHQATLAAVLTL